MITALVVCGLWAAACVIVVYAVLRAGASCDEIAETTRKKPAPPAAESSDDGLQPPEDSLKSA